MDSHSLENISSINYHDQPNYEGAKFLFVIFTFCLVQVLLFEWKRRYFDSYQMVTLGLVIFIPPFIFYNQISFILFYLCFTVTSFYLVFLSFYKTISPTTPRRVYGGLNVLFKFFGALCVIGSLFLCIPIFGSPFFTANSIWLIEGLIKFGIHSMLFGLYFGLISRDLSDIFIPRMAAHIGYLPSAGSLPSKHLDSSICAICGNCVNMSPPSEFSEGTISLNCGHRFHELCIRGWCIVGKKQTCPYCRERVNLRSIFKLPWLQFDIMFADLLDMMRYCIGWVPVVVLLLKLMFMIFDLNWAKFIFHVDGSLLS